MSTRPLFILLLCTLQYSILIAQSEGKIQINYAAFRALTSEVQSYRVERLIDIDTFNEYSKDRNTIILDARSKEAYDDIHIKGAIHLNFSDFTSEKLAQVIPDKNTRILIYCNNNFQSPRMAMLNKSAPLALNIPTFINLYGYGYKNIYELRDYLSEDDERIKWKKQKKKKKKKKVKALK